MIKYTWSVQKVSPILSFRGLRIFDFRFFFSIMLVLMSLTYADKIGHFECSVNFWQLFCLDVFWLVFDFCLFQKMDQKICSKFCVIKKIKCPDAFRSVFSLAFRETVTIAGRVVNLISIDWESGGVRGRDSLDSLILSIWDIIYRIGDSDPISQSLFEEHVYNIQTIKI